MMATRRTTKKKEVSSRKAGRTEKTAVTELNLGKELTIAKVADWHQKLTGIFDVREPISVDGGDIERIDSTGLQLLVALMKEAEATGVEIKWSAASELLQKNANHLGLSAVLHLDTS
jgi:anti-anti-sigma factor